MVSLRPAVRIESVEVGDEARSLSLCDLGEKQNLYRSRHQNQKSPAVFVPPFVNSYLNEIAFSGPVRSSAGGRKISTARRRYGQIRFVPHLHAALLEESLINLQGVLSRRGRRVRRLVEGLHVLDIHYPSVTVYVGDRERDQGIPHPERAWTLPWKDKEHAGVLGQRGPLHEAPLLLGLFVGDLSPYLYPLTASGVYPDDSGLVRDVDRRGLLRGFLGRAL